MLPGITDLRAIEVVAFGLVAAAGLAWARHGATRAAVLLVFNLGFLFLTASTWTSVAVIAVFMAVFYCAGRLHRRFPNISEALLFLFFGVAFIALAAVQNGWGLFAPFGLLQIVGLSYLVFRGISYVFDAPRLGSGSVLAFVNFMLFFPALIAGPIERAAGFIPRLTVSEPVDLDVTLAALNRILSGFIKKYVIADSLAPVGFFALDDPMTAAPLLLWISLPAQLLIIYLDFAGYCDIVIGFARMVGFRLTENFDRPFMARNLQEFWARWHISLTSFAQDYVFVPATKAAASRFGMAALKRAVIVMSVVTMLVVALWHGFSWGFATFGLLHGANIALVHLLKGNRWFKRPKKQSGSSAYWLALDWTGRVSNYLFVSLTLMLWQYSPWQSLEIVARMFGRG